MRALVTRHVFPEAIELLQPGLQLDYHDQASGLSAAELQDRVGAKEGLLCQLTDDITTDVIAAGDSLKVIANTAVGYDNIDVAVATARGIVVTNTPGVLTES